ncbi:hypothetical protein SAMN05421878_11910 [Actinobaculum suis]|uniref:Uncharacterized protein n=1 Tax=Actinobaculum suis TaxID=1657 RepID=A0A1G7EK37_9ACTO|nr:hypothetical protein [Actinobaculum suis]SDE64022.1 hypothetical protein SAMN05421878_11910 [Actinobaculum suis]
MKKLLLFLILELADIAIMFLYSMGTHSTLGEFIAEWWLSFLITSVGIALSIWVFPEVSKKIRAKDSSQWEKAQTSLVVWGGCAAVFLIFLTWLLFIKNG